MSALFSAYTLRQVTFRNRVWVSPMCQYSARDGFPTDWHMVHLGSRAVGGAGMVMIEATAVTPEGRISPDDCGLWADAQIASYQRITNFVEGHGAVPAIQLAHAGRKASTDLPWNGGAPLSPDHPRGWLPAAPSAMAFNAASTTPHALSKDDMDAVLAAFVDAAKRSLQAGFKVIELHMAHGYLLHQFLSPLTNKRDDEFGGVLENRLRFPLAVAKAVRAVWPEHLPLLVRISATDWVEGGWDLPQSITLCRALKDLGIDLIDCSTGGLVPDAKIPVAPLFQVQFAKAIRAGAGIATAAVGLITTAQQGEDIVAKGDADAVFLGRAFLRDPYWALHAAQELKADSDWPNQYLRGRL